MSNLENFKCDICGASYISSETSVWKAEHHMAVSIPCFTMPWVIADVDGVELTICESCYRKQLVRFTHNHDVHKQFAIEYLDKGLFRNCIRCVLLWLKVQPDNHEAYGLMALAFERLGKARWAEISYKYALKINPNDVYLNHNWSLFIKSRRN